MRPSHAQRKAQAAWERIESLGGHGVWEPDMVVVSLADTGVTDADLSLFRDFPGVQILDLSRTAVGDSGLAHLAGLDALEELIVIETRISAPALDEFRRARPAVRITTGPPTDGASNPFTAGPH
jgi:hypothetical protein